MTSNARPVPLNVKRFSTLVPSSSSSWNLEEQIYSEGERDGVAEREGEGDREGERVGDVEEQEGVEEVKKGSKSMDDLLSIMRDTEVSNLFLRFPYY